MNQRRESTKTIWKTVVFAGAMLGSAACGSKAKPATTTPDPAEEAKANTGDPCATPDDPCANPDDPCADPCGDRVRGVSDEGDVGRGFVLS
jgi:hypothetical protein